jgi:hypothetical protein
MNIEDVALKLLAARIGHLGHPSSMSRDVNEEAELKRCFVLAQKFLDQAGHLGKPACSYCMPPAKPLHCPACGKHVCLTNFDKSVIRHATETAGMTCRYCKAVFCEACFVPHVNTDVNNFGECVKVAVKNEGASDVDIIARQSVEIIQLKTALAAARRWGVKLGSDLDAANSKVASLENTLAEDAAKALDHHENLRILLAEKSADISKLNQGKDYLRRENDDFKELAAKLKAEIAELRVHVKELEGDLSAESKMVESLQGTRDQECRYWDEKLKAELVELKTKGGLVSAYDELATKTNELLVKQLMDQLALAIRQRDAHAAEIARLNKELGAANVIVEAVLGHPGGFAGVCNTLHEALKTFRNRPSCKTCHGEKHINVASPTQKGAFITLPCPECMESPENSQQQPKPKSQLTCTSCHGTERVVTRTPEKTFVEIQCPACKSMGKTE